MINESLQVQVDSKVINRGYCCIIIPCNIFALCVAAVVVDVSKMIRDTRLKNYEVKPKDLMDWEEEHGVIPDGALVFIYTSWGKMVNNYWNYAGLDQNNKLNFPGNERKTNS